MINAIEQLKNLTIGQVIEMQDQYMLSILEEDSRRDAE
jgi:hypothetical protein